MNYIDIILLLPLLYGAYRGFSRGLIIEVYPIHCHPEYEINLVMNTRGSRIVGDSTEDFGPLDLVMTGLQDICKSPGADFKEVLTKSSSFLFVFCYSFAICYFSVRSFSHSMSLTRSRFTFCLCLAYSWVVVTCSWSKSAATS